MKGNINARNNSIKIFIIIIILIKIHKLYCHNCKQINILENSECFNIIYINTSSYRSGHFAKNKNGDIIVEYSSNEKRLFYGLYKNGKYIYEEDSHFKEITISGIEYKNIIYKGRYESDNIFVSTKDDITKSKEYLLSLSSFKTLIELYDIKNGLIYSNITEKVFNNGIFSYQFSLFELIKNDMNTYICIYNHDNDSNEYQIGDYFSIKKLYFYENTENQIDVKLMLSSHKIQVRSSRIINGFITEDSNYIYVVYLSNLNDTIKIDKYNEENLESEESRIISNKIYLESSGHEKIKIFKALYLKDNIFSLIYFETKLIISFNLFNISSNYRQIVQKYIDINIFPEKGYMNDFVKINNESLVFITSKDNKINFLFFDLYNNYTSIKIRFYSYISNIYYFDNEISGFNYNDYLIFTITAIKNGLSAENCNSLLMMFGYANGTDSEINLLPYLSDINSNETNLNLVINLLENLIIENNIFEYEKINKIKLIHIPEQIIIFNGENLDKILENNDILEPNYKLIQNNEFIKNNNFYYLEYQYIIKEPKYETFYNTSKLIPDNDEDFSDYYIPKIFYGRTNTLKFKLCHKFCGSCESYGSSDNEQKCLSCLPEYQYDYFRFSETNCVPEGYYYNIKINQLEKCNNLDFKFIKDEYSNKTFCFPLEQVCSYEFFILDKCPYDNYSNYFILYELIPNLINTYPKLNGKNIIIKGEENITFQITTDINEKNILKNLEINVDKISVLELKGCEDILIEENIINPNDTLIILKVEKNINNVRERMVQYEIYHPETKKKLNLSSCNLIELNIPIILSEKSENYYYDLKEQGYDLLNINDNFFQDICSNYESKDGTDVLLADRKNDFYDNNLTCQNGCHYSSFSEKTRYLKCECEINYNNITLDKFKEIIYDSFSSVIKYSNYKFMKCYKLVFSVKSITKNYGSIILIILFLGHVSILIIYIFKGIKPIKEDILKIVENLKKESKSLQKKKTGKKAKTKRKRKSSIINNNNNPPPKNNSKRRTEVGLFLSRRISTKCKVKLSFAENVKDKNDNNNDNNNNDNNNINNNNINNIKGRKTAFIAQIEEHIKQMNTLEFNSLSKLSNFKDLDDYELNTLNYKNALKLDKRSFLQIYCSSVRKKHIIMFAFCTNNDFNLNYFKISKIIFLFGTNFALNVLFFFDESMHIIYINAGGFNLIQQIPQIIYSSLVTTFIEFIINFLILSEADLHDIKNNVIKQKDEYLKNISEILKCFKIKFIIYFIMSFSFLIFYWYFISSFCAVYENTQIIYIEDSLSSFAMSLLYSFLKLLIFSLCRFIALRCNKDSIVCECLYKFGA